MLAFLPNWTYSLTKLSISESTWLDFEFLFGIEEFPKSPSEVELNCYIEFWVLIAHLPLLIRPRITQQCHTSVSRLANLSYNCQMVCPFLFCSRKLWEIAQGLSEQAQCIQRAILNRFLLSTLSGMRISSSHQFVNLPVSLCAKFGALLG